ncbi:Rne/Rng family ribonuclease [Modestobacter sp. SYSU DS0657]
MADRIDDNDSTTEAPETSPVTAPPGSGPAPEAGTATEPETPVEEPDDEPVEDETVQDAAAEASPEPVAPQPAEEPEAEAPRFGAQFSSPEPTAVTARPRRRATRPALAADPDSVTPPPPAPPVAPAFVSFMAPPEPEAVSPRRRSRRTEAESPADPEAAPRADRDEQPAAPSRRSRRRRPADTEDGTPDVEDVAALAAAEQQADRSDDEQDTGDRETDDRDTDDRDTDDRDTDDRDTDDRDGDDGGSAGSRRRRRGRRGRGRGRSGDDSADTDEDAPGQTAGATRGEDTDDTEESGGADDAEDTDDAEGSSGSSTRRRRRRRRRGSSGEAGDDATEDADDRPERAGRNGRVSSEDDVKGVAGSTRLEAKRQRRREGRDGGRRRAPILSESEFLARREAVDRAMVIRQQGERTQIAVLEDDVLVEHYVTQAQATSFAGNVYLGRVQNVLPSMEAAFVDIGKGRNAVLYAGEVNWDAAGLTGKSRSIETALKSGDKVLVQVTKDPIGHKGARLTQQVNLPGRFLVYVPGGSMTGISRKLPDKERTRLKDILKKIVPEDAGVIIRTAAEGASEEELTRDVARLQAQWEVIQTKAASTSSAPTLLYGEPDLAIRVIRDVFNEDFKRLVVQGDDAWDTVEAYVAHVSPELSERLQRYTGTGDVFRDLRIDEQLAKALDRKVWLPSGGSLVIDRTEAMTVVDVNTGKFTGSGGNLEQTVTRNNIEAAEEIVRQLRLRDIGGIIVIDFIDMVLESNRDLVLRRLTECLGRDRTKHQVAEVTSLGLVQMTRKRVGQGLLEVFSEPCEHCRGRGVLVHTDPVDEKRRGGNGGNGGGGNGNGGGSGQGNGGGRNRDQNRADNAGKNSGKDSGKDTGKEPARASSGADADVAADPATSGEASGGAAGAEEQGGEAGTEGRSSRRSRGRRGRGQSGEARAAEDAAVLAASGADGDPAGRTDQGGTPGTPEESLPDGAATAVAPEPTEVPTEAHSGAPAATEAATPDTVLAGRISETPQAPAVGPDEVPAAEPDEASVPVESVPVVAPDAPVPPVVVAPQPVAEPDAPAAESAPDPGAPAPARPRRRRAASRPAGPPAS